MPKERAPHATKADVSKRVSTLVKMYLDGYGRHDLIQYATEKWGIGQESMDKLYFPLIRAQIDEQAKAHIATAYTDAIERAQQLLRLAMQQKNLRVAHLAQTELNKLQGLYAAQKVHVEGKIEGELTDLSHLTFEQLMELKHGKKPD